VTTERVTACDELTVQYGNGDFGVRDVSVAFQPGLATAIVGPSGSGKSSLLNAFCGLAPVVAGSITIYGNRVSATDQSAFGALRRHRIGTVFQQGLLLADLNCIDNVALPMRLLGRRRARARACAHQIMESLGVAHLGRKHTWELSGGERQRVAVARALVNRPPLILADEPTGALDRANSMRTLDLLLTATKTYSATVVIVSHDSAIADRCDTVVHMLDGRIVEAHAP